MARQNETRELLDVQEAAAYLRLSAGTLNKLRSTGGSPPFIKVRARVLYDRADLDHWLDARKRRSTREVPAGAVA